MTRHRLSGHRDPDRARWWHRRDGTLGLTAVGVLAVTLGVVAVMLILAGCMQVGDTQAPGAPRTATEVTAPVPAYDRDAFGGGWADEDRDGCDTREEVLSRDSGADRCPPTSSRQVTITDPYTGQVVTGRPEIDIDHAVSLRDAWDSGASTWTRQQRVAFANDDTSHVPDCPRCSELVAASDDVNRDKSDLDPSQWIPTTPEGRCYLALTYQAVKDRYELTITPSQDVALVELAGSCPGSG